MSLITFRGRQVSIPQEVYRLVCRSDPALRFHQKYLNLCSEDERRSYIAYSAACLCVLFFPHSLTAAHCSVTSLSVSRLLHVSLISHCHTYAIPCVYAARETEQRDKSFLRDAIYYSV